MEIFGYIRVSPKEQNEAGQMEAVRKELKNGIWVNMQVKFI